ncbi:DNA polymerase III subunit tau [Geobacillus sp. BCO2]|nr:DNA polymerase III subunit tau [Geobacillus sp. BCO2]
MAMRWEQLAKRQPVVAKMLQSGLEKGRISHAYLFEGQRGTGKKAASLLLAKCLFCLSPIGVSPCLECRNCRRIDSGNHPDVRVIGQMEDQSKRNKSNGCSKSSRKQRSSRIKKCTSWSTPIK